MKRFTINVYDAETIVEHDCCPSCAEIGCMVPEDKGPLEEWHCCQICEIWTGPLVSYSERAKSGA